MIACITVWRKTRVDDGCDSLSILFVAHYVANVYWSNKARGDAGRERVQFVRENRVNTAQVYVQVWPRLCFLQNVDGHDLNQARLFVIPASFVHQCRCTNNVSWAQQLNHGGGYAVARVWTGWGGILLPPCRGKHGDLRIFKSTKHSQPVC